MPGVAHERQIEAISPSGPKPSKSILERRRDGVRATAGIDAHEKQRRAVPHRLDVDQVVFVALDQKVKTPIQVHSGLPDIIYLVKLLCTQ